MENENEKQLLEEIKGLRIKLAEAEETISSILSGGVDAIVVSGSQGEQVFTLTGAERAYRVLIETMNQGAASLNREGLIIYCNQRLAEMIKTPLEKVIGVPMRQFIRASDLPLFDNLMGKGSQESGKGEVALINGDGTVLPVLLSVSELQKDNADICGITVTDLSAQKHIEDELRRHRDHLEELVKDRTNELETANRHLREEVAERKKSGEAVQASEIRYRRLFESAQDGILILDAETGMVVDVNPSMVRLLGFTKAEFLGKTIWELGFLSDIFPNKANFLELQEQGRIRYENRPLEAADGRKIDVEFVGNVHEVNGNKVIQCNIRDIAERKYIAVELEKTRQNQLDLKDNFLSHVSHELRTPLTVIHQFVSILLDEIPGHLNEEQRQYLDITMKNIKSLRGMIEDLLEATRAQTGKLTIEPRVISLFEIVEEVIYQYRNTADEYKVILSSHITGDAPLLYADPQRTRQILINLIDNGIKFSPQNCTITIESSVYREDPGFMCVTVADNGEGIPPEKIETIFERLSQLESNVEASRKGFGLGLSICKDLVSRHGGKIWAESQVDYGSTFYFTLPIFTFAGLLLPILTQDNLKAGVHLLSIETVPIDKGIDKKTEEMALMELWQLLNRCVLVDKDIILPRIGRLKSGEMFFLAVCCSNEENIGIIIDRIQSQVAKAIGIQDVLITQVSSVVIGAKMDVPTIEHGTHLDELRKSISESIKDKVLSSLSQRRK